MLNSYAEFIVVKGLTLQERITLVEAALNKLPAWYDGKISLVAASDKDPHLTDDQNAVFRTGQFIERILTSAKLCKEPEDIIIACDWYDICHDGNVREDVAGLLLSTMATKVELEPGIIANIGSVEEEDSFHVGYDPVGLAKIIAHVVGIDLDEVRD